MNRTKTELPPDEICNIQDAYDTVFVIAENSLKKLFEMTNGLNKTLILALIRKLESIDRRVVDLSHSEQETENQ